MGILLTRASFRCSKFCVGRSILQWWKNQSQNHMRSHILRCGKRNPSKVTTYSRIGIIELQKPFSLSKKTNKFPHQHFTSEPYHRCIYAKLSTDLHINETVSNRPPSTFSVRLIVNLFRMDSVRKWFTSIFREHLCEFAIVVLFSDHSVFWDSEKKWNLKASKSWRVVNSRMQIVSCNACWIETRPAWFIHGNWHADLLLGFPIEN